MKLRNILIFFILITSFNIIACDPTDPSSNHVDDIIDGVPNSNGSSSSGSNGNSNSSGRSCSWKDEYMTIETDHPYMMGSDDQRWTINLPGADKIRIHFVEFNLRMGDVLNISYGHYDDRYDGNRGRNFSTNVIYSDKVNLSLQTNTSDFSTYYFGFEIDKVEAYYCN